MKVNMYFELKVEEPVVSNIIGDAVTKGIMTAFESNKLFYLNIYMDNEQT